MTFPTPALATTDVSAASAHLDVARLAVDDATVVLRLAAGLAWESPAGEACRAEVSGLLGVLDADGGTLDQAALVTRAVGS